jgi:hypothetical protein
MTEAETKKFLRRLFWRDFAVGLLIVLLILGFVLLRVYIGWDGGGDPLR